MFFNRNNSARVPGVCGSTKEGRYRIGLLWRTKRGAPTAECVRAYANETSTSSEYFNVSHCIDADFRLACMLLSRMARDLWCKVGVKLV